MTAYDVAMKLLNEHECKLDCYRNDKKNCALSDTKTLQNENADALCGFSPEEIAAALQQIGDEQPYEGVLKSGEVEVIDLCEGCGTTDVGKYSVSNMYDCAQEKMAELLASKKMFDTWWMTSQRGFDSARVTCNGHEVWVEAAVTVDSLEDYAIIQDADEWSYDNGIELTDADLNAIADYIILGTDYVETYEAQPRVLPLGCSVDDVLQTIYDLTCEARLRADENFEQVKATVREYVMMKKKELEGK